MVAASVPSGLPLPIYSSIQEQTASGSNPKSPTPVNMEPTFPVGAGGTYEFCFPESEYTMDDLLPDESGAGDTPLDPHSSGDTSNYSTAADATEVDAAVAGQGQPVPHLVGLAAPTAATVASNHSTADDAMDFSASDWTEFCPDLSSQMELRPGFEDEDDGFDITQMLELLDNDPSRTWANILPPDGSTPCEIIEFLKREGCKHDNTLPSMDHGVNRTLAEEDQTDPKAVRRYVTTVEMIPDQKSHGHGYWKEKQFTPVRHVHTDEHSMDSYDGIKKTFQFHKYDGTKTNWFMDEYIPTESWGIDLFMEPLRFRKVYEGEEVPGEPTSPDVTTKEKIDDAKKHRMQGSEVYYKVKEVPDVETKNKIVDAEKHRMQGLEVCYKGEEVSGEPTSPDVTTKEKIDDAKKHRMQGSEVYYKVKEVSGEPTSPDVKTKNKIVTVKKHRKRGPDNLVIKGESPVWQHFIKIYDRHPELEGSKVVYALCCHCKGVLKASTENGTNSLLKHCKDNCPVIKNKEQQPSSSSPNSIGNTGCPSAAADTGSSSLDQDFNVGVGLPQSGGGGGCALVEKPVRASCKRKRLARGSSSQRSTPPELNLVESEASLIQSDPSSADIKPPTGSTDIEIILFLKREASFIPSGKEVNLSLGEQYQMAPMAVRSCVTTVKMMRDQNPHNLGYWKEKQVKPLREDEPDENIWSFCCGLKITFQFHMNDGTKTNWFKDEYVPTDRWGHDLFMKPLRYREVYEGEVPEVKKKKKIAAGKKHRSRCPENMVIEGESRAWQHFIKIYDKHPELEGSKVIYAVCCHCEGVLKAGTGNGTKSLLTHCDRTCPVKNNKNQQPSLSSYQENRFGILVGVGVP